MCKVELFWCWSLRTGTVITVILTILWTIYVLAVAIYFFTSSGKQAVTLHDDALASVDLDYGVNMPDPEKIGGKNATDLGKNGTTLRTEKLQAPGKNEWTITYTSTRDKFFGIFTNFVLGYFYTGFTVLGAISFVSLLIAVIQVNPYPIIFWFIFITILLVLHLTFAVVHLATDETLNYGIKLGGLFFALLIIYPWIVTYSYYQELSMPSRATFTRSVWRQPSKS